MIWNAVKISLTLLQAGNMMELLSPNVLFQYFDAVFEKSRNLHNAAGNNDYDSRIFS